ncbi:MAG TPA: phage holin family protein [Polyangia bacterium]|jgi:putative membrane protein|nr:phage holin family protein [Polyangia bacterium]
MYMLLHLAVLTLTIVALARTLPDVQIKSIGSAFIVAVVFSVLNFFLGWFIKLMLVVPTILTLGVLILFIPFIVNTILLWLTDKVLSTFRINSLASLLMSAGAITAVNALMHFALRSLAAGHGYLVSPGPTRWI